MYTPRDFIVGALFGGGGAGGRYNPSREPGVPGYLLIFENTGT
jgi:hypothetical protein